MKHHSGSPRSRLAGPMLASGLVFLLGALGTAFIASAGGGNPLIGGVILGGGLLAFVLFWLILSLLFRSATGGAYRWVFSKQSRPELPYEPQRRKTRQDSYGTNRPPSADELRELKDSPRTWIPSNSRRRRSEP